MSWIFDAHESHSDTWVAKFFGGELKYKDLLFLQRNGFFGLLVIKSYLKQLPPTSKELKNKTILNLKQY